MATVAGEYTPSQCPQNIGYAKLVRCVRLCFTAVEVLPSLQGGSVTNCTSAPDTYGGHGLISTKDVEPGEEFLVVLRDSCLLFYDWDAGEELIPIVEQMPPTQWAPRLALHMLCEYVIGMSCRCGVGYRFLGLVEC